MNRKADVIELLDAHAVIYVKGVQRVVIPVPIEMVVDQISIAIKDAVLYFQVATKEGVASFTYRGNYIIHWTMLPTGETEETG